MSGHFQLSYLTLTEKAKQNCTLTLQATNSIKQLNRYPINAVALCIPNVITVYCTLGIYGLQNEVKDFLALTLNVTLDLQTIL